MAEKSKLIKCKHCGAEIAASSKTCPQCGGKNKKPFYKNPVIIVLLVVVIVIAIASAGGSDEPSGKPGGSQAGGTDDVKQSETVYTTYKVSELMSDLNTNALSAADKYKGQYVELTGELSVIDSSGDYISLRSGDDPLELVGVQCFVKADEQLDIIRSASVGDTLVVKGKITDVGEVLGYWLDIDSISKA